VARILIVGGGCRGLALARQLNASGHTLRITTRSEDHRAAIEGAGAECWIGDPGRLATLRGVLDGVAVAIWALATATGPEQPLRELHDERVAYFATQAIDSTVRGLIYESGGPEAKLLDRGEAVMRSVAERNAIPLGVLRANPLDEAAWCREAAQSVESFLTSA
jgi:hypothetical protein